MYLSHLCQVGVCLCLPVNSSVCNQSDCLHVKTTQPHVTSCETNSSGLHFPQCLCAESSGLLHVRGDLNKPVLQRGGRRGGKVCHWGTRLSPRSHGPVFCRVRARRSPHIHIVTRRQRAPCLKKKKKHRRGAKQARAANDRILARSTDIVV